MPIIKRLIKLTASVLCLCMLVQLIPQVHVHGADPKAEYEAKLNAAKEKKAEYEAARDEAQKTVDEFKAKQADIAEFISSLDEQLNEISLKIYDLEQDIAKTEKKLKKTEKALKKATAKKQNQYDTMAARIKYIYENGDPSFLDVMLASSDISDFLNQVEYVSDIHEYDNELFDRFKEAESEENDQKLLLEASLSELEEMKKTQELELATSQELMDIKQAEIEKVTEELGIADELLFTYIDSITAENAEIEKIIEEEEKRVAEEERKRKEEEERLRKAREAAAKKRDSNAANVELKNYSEEYANIVLTDITDPYSMIWPLPGDHSTFSKFGYRKAPIKGASTYHQGWDIGGVFGSPIVAVLAGTVISASNNSSAGNYVKIDHGDGFVTVYCHASRLLVSTGDYVQQGETIALCGSTGVSTSPHLHFSVMSNGVYIDPDPYIGWLE